MNAISGSGVNAVRGGNKLNKMQSGINVSNLNGAGNKSSLNPDGLLRIGGRTNQGNAQSQNQLQVKQG